MPIYEYKCPSCEHVEEDFRQLSQTDNPPPKCPNGCESEMQRVFSVSAGHVKRSPAEMQKILKKRSSDHYKKHISPHRKDIERKALKMDTWEKD